MDSIGSTSTTNATTAASTTAVATVVGSKTEIKAAVS